jgi:hypothetical protein
MRRIHIISRCDHCGIEQLLSDATENELGICLTTTGKMVPTIPLVDDDWQHHDGKDYCPDCALEHVAAPDYFPDTLEEAAL